MSVRRLLVVLCGMSLLAPEVHAVTPPPALVTQLTNEVAHDSLLLSGWMVDQLKYAVPFNSTSGNVVPSQLKIFGIEAGVEGVVSSTKIDNNALHNLPTSLVDTHSIDTFSRFPMPMILAHAKLGLPFGFDGGVRVGGIPKQNINHGNNKGSIKNKVFGIDIRKKIIDEGVTRPFGLTLGLSFTHADGSFDMSAPFNSIQTPLQGGYTGTLSNGIVTNHSDWKTNSVGAQVLLDKQILFITPYIGVSSTHNSGTLNNAISSAGDAVVSDSLGNPVGTQAVTAVGASSVKPNKWDNRALVGVEFSFLPFLKMGIGGEYAGSKNIAGSVGLRFQFR
jgi:hypothetical protein